MTTRRVVFNSYKQAVLCLWIRTKYMILIGERKSFADKMAIPQARWYTNFDHEGNIPELDLHTFHRLQEARQLGLITIYTYVQDVHKDICM